MTKGIKKMDYKKSNEFLKCEECGGKGEFYSFITEVIECSACNGTGSEIKENATEKTYFPNCS